MRPKIILTTVVRKDLLNEWPICEQYVYFLDKTAILLSGSRDSLAWYSRTSRLLQSLRKCENQASGICLTGRSFTDSCRK